MWLKLSIIFSVDVHPLCIIFFVSFASMLNCRSGSPQLILLLLFQIHDVLYVMYCDAIFLLVIIVEHWYKWPIKTLRPIGNHVYHQVYNS